MKYLGTITDNKDLTTKEYVDNADAQLNSKIKFTEYTNVTQLGLTSGSATVVAVYRAMVTPGRFVGSNDQFASGDVPSGSGTVVIEKLGAARGYVWFYGKGSTPGDYRMFLGARAYNGNDSNLPTGEWIAEPTRAEVDALNSNITLTLTRTENSYVDATAFARNRATKRGNMLFCLINCEAKCASVPDSFVEIGRISGWSAIHDVFINVPAQQSGAPMASFAIRYNGIIEIFFPQTMTGAPFFRTTVCVPCA